MLMIQEYMYEQTSPNEPNGHVHAGAHQPAHTSTNKQINKQTYKQTNKHIYIDLPPNIYILLQILGIFSHGLMAGIPFVSTIYM